MYDTSDEAKRETGRGKKGKRRSQLKKESGKRNSSAMTTITMSLKTMGTPSTTTFTKHGTIKNIKDLSDVSLRPERGNFR